MLEVFYFTFFRHTIGHIDTSTTHIYLLQHETEQVIFFSLVFHSHYFSVKPQITDLYTISFVEVSSKV